MDAGGVDGAATTATIDAEQGCGHGPRWGVSSGRLAAPKNPDVLPCPAYRAIFGPACEYYASGPTTGKE